MARSLLSLTSRMGDVNPVAGSIYDAGSYQDTTSMKIGSVGAQVRTITVGGTPATAEVYTTTVGAGGTDVVSTLTLSAADATSTTTAAAALANDINNTSGIANILIATSSAAVVTLTGRQKGASATFTMTASASGASTLSVGGAVAPTDATAVPFGCMCERSTATRLTGSTYIGAAVGTGTYTAQVDTWEDLSSKSIIAGDFVTCTIIGDFDGLGDREYTISQAFITNVATTLTRAAAALNAILPANSVSVGESSGVLTLTAEIAGLGFTSSGAYSESGTFAAVSVTLTTPNACPIGGGIALKALCVEQDSSEVSEWTIGDIFSGLTEGKAYVRLDDDLSVAVDDPVFVRVTASASEQVGAFRNAADSTDCLPLSAYGFEGKYITANSTDMDGNTVAAIYLRRSV